MCQLDSRTEIEILRARLAELEMLQVELSQQLARQKEEYARESTYLTDWYFALSGQKSPEAYSCQKTAGKIRHYLNYMMDHFPVNIFWIDTQGVVLGYNTTMEAVCAKEIDPHYPASPDSYVGKNITDFVDPNIIDTIQNNNAKVLAGDTTQIFEEHVPTINGGEKIFLSYKSPIFDDDNNKIGLTGVSLDITERKRAEDDLRLAKEAAESAHMAKLQFLKNMQHDVRTPLSCIKGSVKILSKMEDDPHKLEFLNGILYSSEHLLKMMTNMFEQDQAGEKPVTLQPINVRSLLHDLSEMHRFAVRHKGLTFTIHISDTLPDNITTDPQRLHRILLNLVNNAIKFTHVGGVTVSVSVKDAQWCFTVADTGIGFERCAPVSQTSGLASVNQYVREMGATLLVDSQPGQGSVFKLFLNG